MVHKKISEKYDKKEGANMNENEYYDKIKVCVKGNCCRCGKPLKEKEGLFLCDNCKIEDLQYREKMEDKGDM